MIGMLGHCSWLFDLLAESCHCPRNRCYFEAVTCRRSAKIVSMSRNNEINCPLTHTVPTLRVSSDIASAATTELDAALINIH
ncbi:hypothetical protein Ae201684_017519 [Aphanomyces euteiches]|uniref:Uncharacterized protein n=1 Tax=Aphanomyces euteiches TaxID=100861 RepID=A0A6G0W9S9_9STRA|nr:hypothetical protein Ae201684_017519 [Aphanomyces euteiches]